MLLFYLGDYGWLIKVASVVETTHIATKVSLLQALITKNLKFVGRASWL